MINAVKQTSGFSKEVYTEMKINDNIVNFKLTVAHRLTLLRTTQPEVTLLRQIKP